jgi:hypothetical protein
MPTPQDELQVLDAEPGGFGVFAWQNLTIGVWIGQATPDYVARLSRSTRPIRERYPAGGSSVHIVRQGHKLPDTITRDGFIRLEQVDSDWLAAVSVVVGGSGFWASTLRSAVTAMRVLSKRAFELRISGNLEEVVEWLPAVHLKRSGVVLDPVQLLAMLHKADAAAT